MDVWNEQYFDVGLTVIGYLSAAGLGILAHATLAGHRRRVPASNAAARRGQPPQGIPADPAPQVQFVDLRRAPTETTGASLKKGASETAVTREGRRDRVEIIRLARQMLNAGTPAEMVRRTLPISEMELALLQSTNPN